jgi:hypothetical protein
MARFRYTFKKEYRFTLQNNYTTYLPELALVKKAYRDKKGRIWGKCELGFLTIYKGYSWDGCTGVPNTPETYYASLLHDFGYQFHYLKRKSIDKIFYHQLLDDNFVYAKTYYIGVRILGYPFYHNIL